MCECYSKINVKLSRIHACLENQDLVYLNARKEGENHITLDSFSLVHESIWLTHVQYLKVSELEQIPGSDKVCSKLTLGFFETTIKVHVCWNKMPHFSIPIAPVTPTPSCMHVPEVSVDGRLRW